MQNDKTTHILFASRLVEEKGVDILIDTIKKSIESSQPIIWHVVSDGLFLREISRLNDYHPKNIIYYGKVSSEFLADLYRKVDFLLMPSHFLETFGLTALESLACGTPVIGFAKGGLTSFIPEYLDLDRRNPIDSFFQIIKEPHPEVLDVSLYSSQNWIKKLQEIFNGERITLIHDYHDRIGGAEVYVDTVEKVFVSSGKEISRFSYSGKTSPWIRRLLFMFSILAVWRYFAVRSLLNHEKPEMIWMHSVMRYIGFWGLLAVRNYSQREGAKVYLSHHDVGLLAPFPQSVTDEGEIPHSFVLQVFLSHVSGVRKVTGFLKWCYVWLYRKILPREITHILFAPFMERHVRNHFGEGAKIILLPHSYDEKIFHP